MPIFISDGATTYTMELYWTSRYDLGKHPNRLFLPEGSQDGDSWNQRVEVCAFYDPAAHTRLLLGSEMPSVCLLPPLAALHRFDLLSPDERSNWHPKYRARRIEEIVNPYISELRDLLARMHPTARCFWGDGRSPHAKDWKPCKEMAPAPGGKMPGGWVREPGGFTEFVCPKHAAHYIAWAGNQYGDEGPPVPFPHAN